MNIEINYNYIIVACVFIAFDVITGLLQSFINGTFDSKKMRKGGWHKLALITAIAFGCALDLSQSLIDLGFNLPACNATCAYIALMEILSCVENINKGFPEALPKPLVNILRQAGTEAGVSEEKEE